MTAFTQRWIRHELETRPFSNRIDVVWFAIKRSAWTTVVAVALNFFVYQVVGRLGLSGAVMPPDVLVDTVVTTCVAGSISLMCFYIVGMAIRDIAISRDEFERLSRTDPLTGLMNRRAFFDRANSTGRDYVLVLLDIDRFKAINDTYGHARGDEVLVALAEMLGRHLGRHAVARIGGEEFAAVLTGVTDIEALDLVDGLRREVAERVFEFGDQRVRVTFSAGLSPADGVAAYTSLLNQADKALYLAKTLGRNRVVHSQELASLFPVQEGLPRRMSS